MNREVTLTCGGKNVPMKSFVKTILRDVCLAVVDSLKKTEPGEEIVIRISAQE